MGRVIKANRPIHSKTPTGSSEKPADHVPFEDLRESVISLALAMVHRILQQEIDADPGRLLHIYDQVLGEADLTAGGTLYIHPDDMNLINFDGYAEKKGISLVSDTTVGVGGYRFSSPFGEVDGTIDTLVARFRLALGETS